MTDIYQEIILEEAKDPQNFGELKSADLTLTESNASCGDVITVFLKLSEDKKTIQDIKWQGDGCVITKAAMSVLSGMVMGMKVFEVKNLTKEDVLDKLGLESISAGRLRCLMLGLGAVQRGVL